MEEKYKVDFKLMNELEMTKDQTNLEQNQDIENELNHSRCRRRCKINTEQKTGMKEYLLDSKQKKKSFK